MLQMYNSKCFRSLRGMLQALYIDITKVDQDATYVVMAIHECFKCISQMFHLFQTNVANGLSGCCKNGSRCYIYMHIGSICFKCFQEFHAYVCKCFIWILHMFAIIFKCFSDVFVSVSDACFKCFICLFLCCNCYFWMF
jgi:hypothetical protein